MSAAPRTARTASEPMRPLAPLTATRIRAAGTLLRTFGATPIPRLVDGANKRFVCYLAVGRDADPWVAQFVYELFASTPAAGRGGWARVLVDNLGSRHISLRNLAVPTLVIGSEQDRLLPINASRRIAADAPNLAAFIELTGGHCAILERPEQVNRQLRVLAESVVPRERVS